MTHTVLIVDNNQVNRLLLRSMLENDYAVLEAENGELALDILKKRPAEVSAVVLDISISLSALPRLRDDCAQEHIPVIISVGSEGAELRQKALSLGADDFIQRPLDPEAVKRRIGNLISLTEVRAAAEKLRSEKESLRISEEQYRIAASAGGRVTARYDIKTETYYRSGGSLSPLSSGKTVEHVPETFIRDGVVAQDCVNEYLEFFKKLKSGEPSAHVNVALVMGGGISRWFHCDATVIFDDERKPSQAIIVYTDITDQREKETIYKKWQQTLHQKSPETYTLFRFDLSRPGSLESKKGTLLWENRWDDSVPFGAQIQDYALSAVHTGDRRAFIDAISPDSLLASYHRNRRFQTLEYRELTEDGGTRWLRLTIELVEYPNSSDVEAYLMFEDINEHKTAELRAKELAETDPLTGVLNRAAFTQRVAQAIAENKSSEHAFLMLDVDGFKGLNDAFGHAAGDQQLIDIANSLRSVLRHQDLVGRLGGDEFVIFMRDVPYNAITEKKARQICALTRKAFNIDVQISTSIGIAVYPHDGADFDSLYRSADAALYSVKNSGKDNFAFYDRALHDHPSPETTPISITAAGRGSGARAKRRMLIVDDDLISRALLVNLFKGDFIVDTASDGHSAMMRLRHYGSSISVVLLDLIMPGMDGFTVLEKMRETAETRSIPVIIVTGQDEREVNLRAIKAGAMDFITKPVDPDLIRLRVESAVSRAESERLRAQNSYLLLQSSEEAKYRTVLDSTGTVVIEFDWMGGVFTYDDSIAEHIGGSFDDRRLWQILLSDMIADTADVQAMQELVRSIADDRTRDDGSMTVRLKTPAGNKQWFRMRVFKRTDEFQLTNKLIITYTNINEEVLAEEKLRFQAERDELTGLWNRKTFFEKAAGLIALHKPGYYVMACFDIDSFKVINDQYGSEKGDELLVLVAEVFRDGFESAGGIVCRITADNFAVLYPASFIQSARLREIREAARVLDGSVPPISFSIGRYIVDDLSLSVSGMYDRATLAQSSVKGRFDVHIAQYNESMRQRLLRQQDIVNEMNEALAHNRFEVWFQPQFNYATDALIGSEALVRWRHPQRGLILPNEFVPVFERNGFIYELDKYVWEQTCAYLRSWTDNGVSPLPVSVNISRYDLLRDDLCDVITGLVEKYDIPAELLRLEITESAFSKSTELIIDVVKKLIELGFTVEIDDFGSGYSSLNTLKDVPAQVLKMDMRFLEGNENTDRGGNILESVVRMAKWLGMSVIAEGVESRVQAEYLKSIGCCYIQGYLYARPMPADEYRRHMAGAGREEKLLALETVKNHDNNAFWNPHSMDTLIFNTYVGGACIFEWHNDRIEILRANDKYIKVIGGDSLTVEDALNLVWEEHMDETTAAATRDAVQRTIDTGDDATYEAVYHNLFGDGRDVWLRTTFRVIARTSDRYLIYATNVNLTQERESAQMIRALNESLKNMIDDMPGGFARLRVLKGGSIVTDYVNDKYCKLRGITGEEALTADKSDVMDSVHPDDRELVRATIYDMIATGETRRIQYRLRRSDGAYIPLTVFGRVTENRLTGTIINAYYADMSEAEKRELSVRETIPFVLSAIMQSSTDLSFAKDRELRYLCCSSAFAKMVGLKSEADVVGKTDYDIFSDRALAEKYRADDASLIESGESIIDNIEPIPSDDGLQHYSSTSKYILRDTEGSVIGIYGTGRDVTEYRTAFEQLKLLTDSMPGGLATYVLRPEGLRIAYFNDGLCKMFGCTRSEYEKATRDGVITTVFKEDLPRLNAQIERMMRDGTPVNCTYRIRNMRDDGYKWINLRATPAQLMGGTLQAHAVLYDVTEQKLAEETALIHEAEIRLAISGLGKRIFEYDAAKRTLTEPGSHTALHDVPDSVIESGVIDPDTLPAYRGLFEAILRGERTGSAEYRRITADGIKRWEHTDFYTIFDGDNNPIKAVLVTEDTTKQHAQYELEQARPTLGEEDLLIHALFNLNTGETLDYSYRDGRPVPQNQRTVFTSDGDRLDDIVIDSDERRRWRELNEPKKLLELFERGETQLSIDYRRRIAGGEIIWARNLLRMVREPSGSDILLFEYCYNIEEEKTRELMYNALVHDNYDYVARINGRTKRFAIIANSGVSYGLPPAEGEDFSAAVRETAEKYIHPDDREAVMENATVEGMKRTLQNCDRRQFAFRLVRSDGEVRYKKLTIYYLDRERELIIAAREDVSEPVRQEMLKNAQLSDALSAANQASRAKSQFLSRMSHELRTPMNAIIGLSALAASEISDPRAMEDSIGKIGISARYLLSLINDILEMSRIESGKMSLNEAPFEFERLISDVNGIIYSQAEEKGLDYDVVVNGYTEAYYVGDAVKLQQILVNVLGNAVKFTPTGGKVTLAMEQLRRTKKGATLRFTVTDTGVGIDEAFLPHLFELFSQEATGVTSTYTGTGLGLAITKNLVELMNGTITVKSIKDVGSVFTITVRLGITRESEQYLDSAAAMKLDTLRALIVDDDVIVCRSTEDILRALGMQAEWVDSGRRAVERVQALHSGGQAFDTIIIDWKMPDMDGIETTRRIRAIVGPETTIIIMTAFDWSVIEAEAREAGVDLFMEKPLFQSSVVKAFEQVFMAHRARSEVSPAKIDFTGRRILLAEDNPLNTEVAKRLLEKVGAEVVTSSNGLEALETFATEPDGSFDAILMDIRMPVMDGLTAAKSIRRLKKEGSRTIPIIAMTANAFDEDVELSLSSGMNAHLAKPIEPQLLFQTLKRLMR